MYTYAWFHPCRGDELFIATFAELLDSFESMQGSSAYSKVKGGFYSERAQENNLDRLFEEMINSPALSE